ncbi:hypothetical protein PILCRDRAFT_99247 [Piloderma croceum F 1598]|uniref:Threonine/serine exporter-like N-terminal domain-containing protein n=1 Tax=Piloderma croceum (strain F 1598) TaxID=765440 RepID=A0A0C3AIT5_PILCF|nr:hypothetical protein PILCRDRAFT_99247 [Piloderma croceum F 1598]
MTPTIRPAGEDGKPRPGGTTRTPGVKTPRKVQWATDGGADPSTSTHALDEHGLDPDAFETLTVALERHRSSTSHRGRPEPPNISIPALPYPLANRHISTGSLSASIPGTATTDSSAATSTSNSRSASPTHLVPGENHINSNEHDGLPGTTDLERYSRHQAKNVVRAHTRKKGSWVPGWLTHQKRDSASKKQKQARARVPTDSDTDGEKDRESDVEAVAADSTSTGHRMGGGVLSALLTLYDRNQSMHTFSSTSTTRSSLDGHDPSPETTDNTRRNAVIDLPEKPWLHHRPQHPPMPLPDSVSYPPSAPPQSSKFTPSPKRPGYKLSRFSLESSLPTRRTLNVLPTIRRPASLHFDKPASAPSTPSSSDSGSQTPSEHLPRDSIGGTQSHGGGKHKLTGMLAHANHSFHSLKSSIGNNFPGTKSSPSSGTGTPVNEGEEWEKWLIKEREKAREKRKKDEKRRKKKREAFITRHVAEIIQRQEFILKLTRALMMFGGPSHRLQAQIQATARVLDIELSCMYLPDVMLISFDDGNTGTSNIKFIRQSSALDMGKLYDGFRLYWKVIHDKISVSEASAELDILMQRKPMYNMWQLVVIGGMCSASICSVSFSGSFIDSLIVIPMGCLLVFIQLISVRNELYSNVFEITIATLLSFLSAVFAGTHRFCYSAMASSSVVLILPGFIVTLGALELTSRSIVSGAVRLCFAAVYSLFLGFGLAIGAEAYQKMSGKGIIGSQDYSCQLSHDPNGPWWQRTPGLFWAFLTVPMFSLFLSLRNQSPWNRKELLFSIIISCIGWVTNHFTGTKFINQNDISAAVGAFAVGLISNIYGRFFGGNAFVVMITGILFQVPSGLSNGGLLQFASQQSAGVSNSYLSGFQTALQLISVAIGLTVGLSISLVVVHPIQSRKRAAGIFSL